MLDYNTDTDDLGTKRTIFLFRLQASENVFQTMLIMLWGVGLIKYFFTLLYNVLIEKRKNYSQC